MSHGYSHARVQEYWNYVWEEDEVYRVPDDAVDPTYVLGMFPYTSGTLHMGHIRNYAITDAYARFRRMQGEDVLHPMGWDAFGLPAENAAYDRLTDPESWTRSCIEQMREEMETMGFGYDWSREITTADPDYYRWNQWLFKRFYEEDLVDYRAATVNWCPDCETVLAEAQVVEGDGGHDRVCWRCETPVGRRELDQWFFTITDYAEELHAGLEDLDGWPDSVRGIQRNWIGRQEGTEVAFEIPGHGDVDVFTTRLDTVYGATFVALAPGHAVARAAAETDEAVERYVSNVGHHGPDGAPSGVATDLEAVHPLTGESLPVYVAAYVMEDVGTGAVMGVPAHNERDHAFARAHDLSVEPVVEPVDGSGTDLPARPYTDDGMLTNSGDYDGLASGPARERIREDLPAAAGAVTYRLRDWLISRQRYWGTPIPVVHCEDCGHVLVPDEDLPVELPEYVQTTGNPLAANDDFVETTCPDCGGPARRETDTMDTFVDSSWYFLRFLSPDYDEGPFDPERANDWMPIDVYVGGEEHAILHLLYIRFVTRALCDLGMLDVREPVKRLINQGMVLHGGEKMAKSRGNVVAPHEYGAETTRLFVLSAAHPEQDFEWTAKSVGSAYDFQQTLYRMTTAFTDRPAVREERAVQDAYVEREIDRTIAAVTEQYEGFRFHRAITEIQQLARLLRRYRAYAPPHVDVYRRGLTTVTLLVSPVVPFLGEELWNTLRGGSLVAEADWPVPERDVSAYRIERRLVQTTLEDVRDITEMVDIDDPEHIELVVAQDWKYRAYDIARAAEPGSAVVGQIMDDEVVAAHGEAAADFAADLQERQESLPPVLSGERELTLLEQAAWLLDDEFGADVTVRRASDDDRLAGRARPGKPAIHIS